MNESERITSFNVQQHFKNAGVMLPDQAHFTPTEEFWTVIAAHQHIELVECGAGVGSLLDGASRRGLRLRGVDLMPRRGQHRSVEMRDATDMNWSPTRWPVICRPDHGGWATDVFLRAKAQGAFGIYVGLAKNFFTDLTGTHARRVPGVFGAAGERMYVIDPRKAPVATTTRTNRRSISMEYHTSTPRIQLVAKTPVLTAF